MQFKIQPRAIGTEGKLYKRGKTFGFMTKRRFQLSWEGNRAVLTYKGLLGKANKISLERCSVSTECIDPRSKPDSNKCITLEFRDAKEKVMSKKMYVASSEAQRQDWFDELRLCCSQMSIDNMYEIDRVKPLGSGVSGTVYRATERGSGGQWAVKEILKKSIKSDVAEEALKAEANACSILQRHDNIVNMKEFIENLDKYCIVMECVSGGDLVDRIVEPPGGTFTEQDAAEIFGQILNGLEFLHSFKMAHRDLKLDNILLTSKTRDALVKIADFGTARIANTATSLRHLCGTVGYIAPEVVSSKPGYGIAADVWSMGVVLYTLLAGKVPFTGKTEEESFALTRSGVYDVSALSKVSEAARATVAQLLVLDPAKRPTAAAARSLPWVVSCGDPADSEQTENGRVRRGSTALVFAPEALEALKKNRRHCIVVSKAALSLSRYRRMTTEGHLAICTVEDDDAPVARTASDDERRPPEFASHRSRADESQGSNTTVDTILADENSPSTSRLLALVGADKLPPTPKSTSTRMGLQVVVRGANGQPRYRRRSVGDSEAAVDTAAIMQAFNEAKKLQAPKPAAAHGEVVVLGAPEECPTRISI